MEAVSSADFSPEVLACLPQDLPWSISPQDRTYRRDFTGIRYLPCSHSPAYCFAHCLSCCPPSVCFADLPSLCCACSCALFSQFAFPIPLSLPIYLLMHLLHPSCLSPVPGLPKLPLLCIPQTTPPPPPQAYFPHPDLPLLCLFFLPFCQTSQSRCPTPFLYPPCWTV